MEYTENKGRLRSPFRAGTKIDVILRVPVSTMFRGTGEQTRLDEHRIEIKGAIAGPGYISDWKLDGVIGDVLAYRLHEGELE